MTIYPTNTRLRCPRIIPLLSIAIMVAGCSNSPSPPDDPPPTSPVEYTKGDQLASFSQKPSSLDNDCDSDFGTKLPASLPGIRDKFESMSIVINAANEDANMVLVTLKSALSLGGEEIDYVVPAAITDKTGGKYTVDGFWAKVYQIGGKMRGRSVAVQLAFTPENLDHALIQVLHTWDKEITEFEWGDKVGSGTTGFKIGDGKSSADGRDFCDSSIAFMGSSEDVDGDGIPNDQDLCPLKASSDNSNTDGDKLGDICDPDDDNDFHRDENDNCPKTKNAAQKDTDKNGVGDKCENKEKGLCNRVMDKLLSNVDGVAVLRPRDVVQIADGNEEQGNVKGSFTLPVTLVLNCSHNNVDCETFGENHTIRGTSQAVNYATPGEYMGNPQDFKVSGAMDISSEDLKRALSEATGIKSTELDTFESTCNNTLKTVSYWVYEVQDYSMVEGNVVAKSDTSNTPLASFSVFATPFIGTAPQFYLNSSSGFIPLNMVTTADFEKETTVSIDVQADNPFRVYGVGFGKAGGDFKAISSNCQSVGQGDTCFYGTRKEVGTENGRTIYKFQTRLTVAVADFKTTMATGFPEKFAHSLLLPLQAGDWTNRWWYRFQPVVKAQSIHTSFDESSEPSVINNAATTFLHQRFFDVVSCAIDRVTDESDFTDVMWQGIIKDKENTHGDPRKFGWAMSPTRQYPLLLGLIKRYVTEGSLRMYRHFIGSTNNLYGIPDGDGDGSSRVDMDETACLMVFAFDDGGGQSKTLDLSTADAYAAHVDANPLGPWPSSFPFPWDELDLSYYQGCAYFNPVAFRYDSFKTVVERTKALFKTVLNPSTAEGAARLEGLRCLYSSAFSSLGNSREAIDAVFGYNTAYAHNLGMDLFADRKASGKLEDIMASASAPCLSSDRLESCKGTIAAGEKIDPTGYAVCKGIVETFCYLYTGNAAVSTSPDPSYPLSCVGEHKYHWSKLPFQNVSESKCDQGFDDKGDPRGHQTNYARKMFQIYEPNSPAEFYASPDEPWGKFNDRVSNCMLMRKPGDSSKDWFADLKTEIKLSANEAGSENMEGEFTGSQNIGLWMSGSNFNAELYADTPKASAAMTVKASSFGLVSRLHLGNANPAVDGEVMPLAISNPSMALTYKGLEAKVGKIKIHTKCGKYQVGCKIKRALSKFIVWALQKPKLAKIGDWKLKTRPLLALVNLVQIVDSWTSIDLFPGDFLQKVRDLNDCTTDLDCWATKIMKETLATTYIPVMQIISGLIQDNIPHSEKVHGGDIYLGDEEKPGGGCYGVSYRLGGFESKVKTDSHIQLTVDSGVGVRLNSSLCETYTDAFVNTDAPNVPHDYDLNIWSKSLCWRSDSPSSDLNRENVCKEIYASLEDGAVLTPPKPATATGSTMLIREDLVNQFLGSGFRQGLFDTQAMWAVKNAVEILGATGSVPGICDQPKQPESITDVPIEKLTVIPLNVHRGLNGAAEEEQFFVRINLSDAALDELEDLLPNIFLEHNRDNLLVNVKLTSPPIMHHDGQRTGYLDLELNGVHITIAGYPVSSTVLEELVALHLGLKLSIKLAPFEACIAKEQECAGFPDEVQPSNSNLGGVKADLCLEPEDQSLLMVVAGAHRGVSGDSIRTTNNLLVKEQVWITRKFLVEELRSKVLNGVAKSVNKSLNNLIFEIPKSENPMRDADSAELSYKPILTAKVTPSKQEDGTLVLEVAGNLEDNKVKTCLLTK
jgi:hypothetical protein